MKTIDETITGLCRCRYTSCRTCPYAGTKGKSCKEALLDDAADLLAQYRNGTRWIPVSERMPENDHTMAVRTVTQKGVVSWNRAWWDGEFWHGSGSMANVTHWMPISTEVA